MIWQCYAYSVHCQSCFNYNFVCGDGKCLSRSNDDNGVCDGTRNCSDGSDESRCGLGELGTVAQSLHVCCIICVTLLMLLKNDTAFNCSIGQYRCLNGQCISGSSVCDGYDSCGDNSDESQCGTSE